LTGTKKEQETHMDFSFTEAQDAVVQVAKKLFTERLTPQALKAIDAREDRWSPELWAELGSSGLLGTAIAEEHGGSGHGLLELCALLEEAGAAVAPVPLWPTLVACALPIAQFGTDEQKARLLPGVASGKLVLTASLGEVRHEDPFAVETRARRDGDRWLLTGVRSCVQAAHVAERVLVPARTDGGETGLFLLDPRAAGVALEKQIGTTGETLSRLTLEGAVVAASDVLVAPSARGREALEWTIERATVGLCALELGVAGRALRMTAQYTTGRHQFDRPIATFQAVSQRAGDMYVDVETIRLTTWQAAWQLSEGRRASEAVAVAKYWACDAGHRVVYGAQHLHAGIGFDLDYPLHRYYVWSKHLELTLGAGTQQLVRLGSLIAHER
jgi:alkylation response protein AidB-like acyl-CoA dehydrogenase